MSFFASSGGIEVRFDDFRLDAIDAQPGCASARIISSRSGGNGLTPDLPPGRIFELAGWCPGMRADAIFNDDEA